MRVTAELLRAKDACEDQVDLFESLFPAGVEITHELCVKYAGDFDWNWATNNLLPIRVLADYDAKNAMVWADYEAKHVALWADYDAKYAAIWKDYDAKHDALRADYEAERTSLAAFAASHAALGADYKIKCAGLFGSLAGQVP